MDEQNFMTLLLKQSILTLCGEAVNYSSQLEVEGIVSITINSRDVHIVKMHELFLRQDNIISDSNGVNTAFTEGSHMNRSIKQVTQAPDIHYSDHPVTVKEEPVDVNEEAADVNKEAADVQEEPVDVNEEAADVKEEPVDVNEEPFTVKEEPICETGNDSDESKREVPGDTNRTIEYANVIIPDKDSSNASGNMLLPAQAKSIESKLQELPISKATDIACKKCQEIQPNVLTLESHNITVHSQHTCRVCLNMFTSRSNLKRHLRIHTGVKPYSCKQCHKSFARNDDYKCHLLRHTTNKPFRCSICNSGYSDRMCIKTHMKKEHNGKEQHICPQCGETYVNMVLFEQHKKIHPELNDYSCTICSFTGPNGLVYNKHMLTHGPPKEYKCFHCEISFCDPFKYTSHLKLHKDDDLVQTFACCFCDIHLPTFEQFQRHEHSHDNKVLTSQQETEIDDTRLAMDVNESKDQEQMKMNKNKVDFDEGTALGQKDRNSNDYWCADCHQAFETKDLLQDHISNTHEENISDRKTKPSKNAIKAAGNFKKPIASTSSQSMSPYEMLTQVDNSYDYLYDDSTQHDILQGPTRNKAFDEETIVDNDNDYQNSLMNDLSMQADDDSTQHDILQGPMRNKNLNGETIVNNGNDYQKSSLIDPMKAKSVVKLIPSDLFLTQNAMTKVQLTQHKFGLLPSNRSKKGTMTRHMPSSITGHIPVSVVRGLFSNGANAANSISKINPTSVGTSGRKKTQQKRQSIHQSSSNTSLQAIKSNIPQELAECNQAFETKDLFQDNISISLDTGLSDRITNSSKTVVKAAASPSNQSTSSYEMLTQVDNNYDYLYDDSTQHDILQGPMRNKAFDEETIVNSDNEYQKSLTIDLSLKNKSLVKLPPSKMSITQKAIKEVQAVQHKFGISPTSQSKKGNLNRHIPSLSTTTGHIPLFANGVNNSNHKQYLNSVSALRRKENKQKGLLIHQSIQNMHKSNYPQDQNDNAMDIDICDFHK